MNGLDGKVALVTGGSRGIGAAIARRLAAEGADVAITFHSAADRAAKVVTDIEMHGRRGFAVPADSADAAQLTAAVERTVRELGRLDILVNNGGVFVAGPPERTTLEDVDRVLAVNTRGAYVAAQAALRHIGRGGSIVNIGTSFVDRVPHPGVSLYTMSKAALLGLTKGLARDLADRSITVNLVNPGPTDTDMNPAGGDHAETMHGYMAMDRHIYPEEIAATVAHLVGEGGHVITGTSIAVDGGYAA